MTEVTLGDLLTPSDPLGPARHERILRRVDNQASNLLLYKTNLFDEITSRPRPLIIGRRGSGKTAVVNALLAQSAGKNYSYAENPGYIQNNNNIIVFINSWSYFDSLVEQVGHDIALTHGPAVDWTGVLPETSARVWSRHIWRAIFQRIYDDSLKVGQSKKQEYITAVKNYISGRDFVVNGTDITNGGLDSASGKVRQKIIEHLVATKSKCILIIDSLEGYPVHSPRFSKVISGFLRFISDFQDSHPNCRVYCCMPEEIEPFVAQHYPNTHKDGSKATSISRLQWRTMDLLKIVAKRYREFLKLHLSREDSDFIDSIQGLNLDRKDDLKYFFSQVIPETVRNKYGQEENTIAYIIRHTQLLPREFLLIFSTAILMSHRDIGSWRYIDEKAIVGAIDFVEEDLCNQILTPFRPLYPVLCENVKSVVAHLPPIFRGRDLQSCKKLDNITKSETVDCWSTLFSMGIIGYLEDESGPKPGSIYEPARFYYNSVKSITFAPDRLYCFHPIFSGTWNLRNHPEATGMKFVYPAQISSEL
ncbi:hypothetical protein [Caulobacter sp. NIBR1757]|uniref:P-loop ATPase, Sll1717 family n=1 Tax=Caulobacter sp. NIBR1757 TaxID=3016000 RepID=UPI0022F004E2|nr:hypothetical protein [Caulobacter sp. NIBR1757]